ncbi:hypothetical protein VTK56DRAFT_7872 [Thermocarpiscus australiensis]
MDAFESAKPDRFQQSLSSAWASFLNAQHCSREVNAIRKILEERIHQANLSIASLQRDASQQHNTVTAAVAEAKSKIEQHASELKDVGTLRKSLSTLQQEISQDKEYALRKITELSERVAAQQGTLDGMRSVTSQGIRSVEEQYRLALEKIEYLQAELRELKAEKMASEQKLAALEHHVTTIIQTRQGPSEETIRFLELMFSRREELRRLLDRQDCEAHTQSSSQTISGGSMPEVEHLVQSRNAEHGYGTEGQKPRAPAKRKTEEALQTQARSAGPSRGQDIRTLYLSFRDRYKTDPPKSDTDFIWEFISGIESPDMSKYIQESLAANLPDYVTRSRDTRRKNANRHINISKGLTWRKFREALVKIPPPS